MVATETLMVAKRSARILLECCRVFECKRGKLPKTVNINRSDRKNWGFLYLLRLDRGWLTLSGVLRNRRLRRCSHVTKRGSDEPSVPIGARSV